MNEGAESNKETTEDGLKKIQADDEVGPAVGSRYVSIHSLTTSMSTEIDISVYLQVILTTHGHHYKHEGGT